LLIVGIDPVALLLLLALTVAVGLALVDPEFEVELLGTLPEPETLKACHGTST
jgi:hypothetical protein